MSPHHPLTIRRFTMIEQALSVGTMHIHDIAEAVHISKRRATDYASYLHTARRIHIARWVYRKAGNEYPVPVYAIGPGRDAAKPKPTTSQQKGALARKRRNADPDKRDLHLSRNRARKRKIVADPLVAALFGSK